MPLQTITVKLTSLGAPARTLALDIDTAAYTVLDLIIDLKRYDNDLGLCSLVLPTSGLVTPRQLSDHVHDQLRGQQLDVKIFNPITYRNSFNFINNLVGLYEHGLLETTNLMDVEPINHAKLGEWIGFGSGPTTVPREEDNRINNLIWVIYNVDKPVCYNVHGLHRLHRMGHGKLLIPHLNKKIKPDKFIEACSDPSPFRILQISDQDVTQDSHSQEGPAHHPDPDAEHFAGL